MKTKLIGLAIVLFISIVSYCAYNNYNKSNELTEIQLANIEALTSNESGTKCPNGCSDIGLGLNKILRCDCAYDRFSSCNKWGC